MSRISWKLVIGVCLLLILTTGIIAAEKLTSNSAAVSTGPNQAGLLAAFSGMELGVVSLLASGGLIYVLRPRRRVVQE
jgi:hypothetical protein